MLKVLNATFNRPDSWPVQVGGTLCLNLPDVALMRQHDTKCTFRGHRLLMELPSNWLPEQVERDLNFFARRLMATTALRRSVEEDDD